jgi:multidrug efflux system membrane fusion protein
VDAFDRGGVKHLASGVVETLDNQIDQTTGTVRVKAVFDNRDQAMFPSQFVNVRLLVDTRRAQIVVPATAIQQGPDGPFVYRVEQRKAVVHPVTVVSTDAERTAVASGVAPGDIVITEGFDRLRNGTVVEIRH